MIANALLTVVLPISLWYISILSLPLPKLIKLSVAIANVEVFIPPPVYEGDAPIHIKRMVIKIVGLYNSFMSTALNPAVLGVVA